MLPIVWRASAHDDLSEIVRYNAAEDPPAARPLDGLIEATVQPTSQHPDLYHKRERTPPCGRSSRTPASLLYLVAAFIEVMAVVPRAVRVSRRLTSAVPA